MVGCPILRALCEGWDKQNARGRASGAEQGYPTLRKEREGWERILREEQMLLPAVTAWGTRSFVLLRTGSLGTIRRDEP